MKKAVAAAFVLGLATAVTDIACSPDDLILKCPDTQIMTVTQATFGQASVPNDCGASTKWGVELAVLSSSTSVSGDVYVEARSTLETFRIVHDLKGFEKNSVGTFKIREGSCNTQNALFIGVQDFRTSIIGWARDSAIVGVKGYTSIEQLEGHSVWIYDAAGDELACGNMGLLKCNSIDKTAPVKAVCDGLQKCLFQSGNDVVPRSPGCSDIFNYLTVDYECNSIVTSGPTPEPSPLPAWVPPPTVVTAQPTSAPSAQPTAPPTSPSEDDADADAGGFDFGGCSGQGTFDVSLEQGNSAVLGQLPANVIGLKIQLSTNGDVDIILYDYENITSFREGEAVIRWCEAEQVSDSRYNCGGLGQQPEVETMDYRGSTFKYSGYNGVTGPGDEYVEVSVGATPAIMTIAAYAYDDGEGTVSYSYTGLDTPCCQGKPNACGGSFRTSVAEGEVTQLGQIPRGKKDLRVSLDALVDIDIQLYNAEMTGTFSEGEAIVAYCELDSCNYGDITAAAVIEKSYNGMQLEYSGWNGVRGYPGSEYIQITGETTRILSMGLLGFQAGSARVDYTYTEVAI